MAAAPAQALSAPAENAWSVCFQECPYALMQTAMGIIGIVSVLFGAVASFTVGTFAAIPFIAFGLGFIFAGISSLPANIAGYALIIITTAVSLIVGPEFFEQRVVDVVLGPQGN